VNLRCGWSYALGDSSGSVSTQQSNWHENTLVDASGRNSAERSRSGEGALAELPRAKGSGQNPLIRKKAKGMKRILCIFSTGLQVEQNATFSGSVASLFLLDLRPPQVGKRKKIANIKYKYNGKMPS